MEIFLLCIDPVLAVVLINSSVWLVNGVMEIGFPMLGISDKPKLTLACYCIKPRFVYGRLLVVW